MIREILYKITKNSELLDLEEKEKEAYLYISDKYEIYFLKPYQLVDYASSFIQSLVFVTGSILFFFEEHKDIGNWFFLAGSLLFCTRPLIRIIHNVHFKRRMK